MKIIFGNLHFGCGERIFALETRCQALRYACGLCALALLWSGQWGRAQGIAAEPEANATVQAEPHADLPAGYAIRHPVDGAVMVWVPGGWFTMGIDAPTAQAQAVQLGYADYHEIAAEESFPAHRVYVQGFFMDKYEVTRERWAAFVRGAAWTPPESGEQPTWSGPELLPAEARLPIGGVRWLDAQRYALWSGKQLPTEAMWEKAARGTDGRWYPWGNALPDPKYGVLSLGNALAGPEPVGSHPLGASPYGCLDMAGNMYEWTSDWMEPYPNSPEPNGSWGHQFVVLRGGSFYHTRHSYRTAKRFGFRPEERYFHVGFRTAWYPPDDFDATQYAVAADQVDTPPAAPAPPATPVAPVATP